jgi:hypothetical protein
LLNTPPLGVEAASMVQHDRQDFDNLVWDKNDEAWAESQQRLQLKYRQPNNNLKRR